MGRRFRWTVLVLVLVVVTGIVILVITVRPGLQDDAQEVRHTWKPLLQPLATRYSALNGVVGALDAAGNRDRDLTKELRHTLDTWDLLRTTTDDVGQAKTADELEGLAARIRATVKGSDRLRGIAALNKSLSTFEGSAIPSPLVKRYNNSVLRYERNRDGTLRSIVATLDGYQPHPTLQLTSS